MLHMSKDVPYHIVEEAAQMCLVNIPASETHPSAVQTHLSAQ
jgi:hypothetical protein